VPDPEITLGKLLLVEYERLKDEQKTRIGFRDNLVYATLASMAAVIAATLSPRGGSGLLLLLPPVCLVLGWTYLVNDEKVSAIGRYLRHTLVPRLAAAAGLTGEAVDAVLAWETTHRSDAGRRLRKLSQLGVDLGIFCLPALSALVVFWVAGSGSALLILLSLIEAVLSVGLAVLLVRSADLVVGG
jgi:hypothetical protein